MARFLLKEMSAIGMQEPLPPAAGPAGMETKGDLMATPLLDGKHILLVDDDAWIRDSLSICLGCEGCRVTTAETAREGLAAVRRGGIDILICDYQLPDRDGLDLLREAKGVTPAMPMVLITAFGSRELYAQAAAIGVDIFVDKPFNSQRIEHAVVRLLEDQP